MAWNYCTPSRVLCCTLRRANIARAVSGKNHQNCRLSVIFDSRKIQMRLLVHSKLMHYTNATKLWHRLFKKTTGLEPHFKMEAFFHYHGCVENAQQSLRYQRQWWARWKSFELQKWWLYLTSISLQIIFKRFGIEWKSLSRTITTTIFLFLLLNVSGLI